MTLSINSRNDLFLNEEGNIETSTGMESVLQNCQTAVQMTKGEALYQSADGIPAFETIWNGSPNFQQVEASIRATILKVKDVTNINSFDFTSNNNKFSYNVEIETIYGTSTLDEAAASRVVPIPPVQTNSIFGGTPSSQFNDIVFGGLPSDNFTNIIFGGEI